MTIIKKSDFIKLNPSYTRNLPYIDFPTNSFPQLFHPERTLLLIGSSKKNYAMQWCYLQRKTYASWSSINKESLSFKRIEDISSALQKLSKDFIFKNNKSTSITRSLANLNMFLSWADNTENSSKYEDVLSNQDSALKALKGYHSYLRSLLQSHAITHATAGIRDQDCISCLSAIHSYDFKNELEPLEARKSQGNEAPSDECVYEFTSILQSTFDTLTDAIDKNNISDDDFYKLTIPSIKENKKTKIRSNYGLIRLIELCCVTYAALVLVDSGANLAVLAKYEEPEDLYEQLKDPDRINLKQKSIKLRAGGKKIDVHLSAISITRLKSFLDLRQKLIDLLECDDILPMFFKCSYKKNWTDPTGISPLDQNFLNYLRRKLNQIGISAPKITLIQIRAYKQQHLAKKYPIEVAAKIMGHSIHTAIKSYCKSQNSTHREEMGDFLRNIQTKLLDNYDNNNKTSSINNNTPVGYCISPGNPSATDNNLINTSCNKPQGCFFCDKYRIHCDEVDIKKLLSCRHVLKHAARLTSDLIKTERIYTAIIDRIDSLLSELEKRLPDIYTSTRIDVEENGHLTYYWERKLQQLHLLGLISDSTPINRNSH